MQKRTNKFMIKISTGTARGSNQSRKEGTVKRHYFAIELMTKFNKKFDFSRPNFKVHLRTSRERACNSSNLEKKLSEQSMKKTEKIAQA